MAAFQRILAQSGRRSLTWLLAGAVALGLAVPAVHALVENGYVGSAPTPVELVANGRRSIHIPAGQPTDLLPRVELERGKSIVLEADFDLERVAVADPNIANLVMTDARTLQVVALAPGSTNLLLWDDRGTLQAAVDVFVGSTRSQVEIKIRELIGSHEIWVEMAGPDTIVLRGTVARLEDRDRAEQLAKAFMSVSEGRGVVNLIDVAGNHQVMLEVKLAEMDKSLGRELEVNYRAAIQAGAQSFVFGSLLGGGAALAPDGLISNGLSGNDGADLFGSYTSGGGSTVDSFLRFAKEQGLAKILAEPTLVARSGERASFLAGGEVPVPVPGGTFGQVSIEFKQFGVGVDFVPTVLSSDRIHLEVTSEVSEPDPTIGVEVLGTAVPGFTTRRVSTSVELSDSQSFVIAGLLQDRTRNMARKVPWLGDVPVLGALFRSQDYQKSETELMIIVTPRLVKPLDPGEHLLPTDSYQDPSDTEFFVLGRDEAVASHAHPNPTADPGQEEE
ncbi:MAG: type II and III secretion system protein family protein [bacterium]|nr:type II and III secretion system protein family protein [bacterium]